MAPLIAFVGVMSLIFAKNKKVQHVGGIIAGIGVLFIGMGMMSDAMVPLRDSETFIHMVTKFSNPVLHLKPDVGRIDSPKYGVARLLKPFIDNHGIPLIIRHLLHDLPASLFGIYGLTGSLLNIGGSVELGAVASGPQ